MASLTPEERLQLEEKREAKALQKEIDERQAETVISKTESETTQNELEENEPNITQEKHFQSEKVIPEKVEPTKEIKLDTEEKVLEFIYNYRGKDGTGLTLNGMISMIIEFSYPGEDILSSPSTRVSLTANPDFSKEDYRRYWKVEGELETYRETSYFGWIVDVETKSVYPMDEVAKSILDALDADN